MTETETGITNYREKCFEAHGSQCIRCYGDRPFEGKVVAHHIDEDRDNNTVENLAPLCNTCHTVWHKNKSRFESFGEFVDSFPWEGGIAESNYFNKDALLSDTEIEILLGERGVSKDYYRQVENRIRNRIRRLESVEMDALEAHGTLADELQDVVCNE